MYTLSQTHDAIPSWDFQQYTLNDVLSISSQKLTKMEWLIKSDWKHIIPPTIEAYLTWIVVSLLIPIRNACWIRKEPNVSETHTVKQAYGA